MVRLFVVGVGIGHELICSWWFVLDMGWWSRCFWACVQGVSVSDVFCVACVCFVNTDVCWCSFLCEWYSGWCVQLLCCVFVSLMGKA